MILDLFHQAAEIAEVEPDAAHRLWQAFAKEVGGQAVYIPVPSSSARAQRDKDILAAWRRGESFAAIACRYDIGEMRVRQVIAKERGK